MQRKTNTMRTITFTVCAALFFNLMVPTIALAMDKQGQQQQQVAVEEMDEEAPEDAGEGGGGGCAKGAAIGGWTAAGIATCCCLVAGAAVVGMAIAWGITSDDDDDDGHCLPCSPGTNTTVYINNSTTTPCPPYNQTCSNNITQTVVNYFCDECVRVAQCFYNQTYVTPKPE